MRVPICGGEDCARMEFEMEEQTRRNILEFLHNRVQEQHILVVGDVMLDRYFYGEVNRISPEAPVPVTLIRRKKSILGGAANVAQNLAKLGCKVSVIGVIGDDHHGRLLLRQMKVVGIESEGLIYGRENTTTKVRILGGHQQMMRIDFEEAKTISGEVEESITQMIQKKMNDGLEAIILSDYDKGVCTEQVCQRTIRLANGRCRIFVDPKGKDWKRYRGAGYITPNVKETAEVMGKAINNKTDELRDAVLEIKRVYAIENVVTTRSEKGMSLFLEKEEIHIPTVAQDVFDVSGAGDTVIAALALGLAGGLSSYDAAVMANFAAGIGVGKVGTYAVSKKDILSKI